MYKADESKDSNVDKSEEVPPAPLGGADVLQMTSDVRITSTE